MSEKGKYKSKRLRQDPMLLRNDFAAAGKWGMPVIRKCELDITRLDLIAADHVRKSANISDCSKTVHFFLEDIKLHKYYDHPEKYCERLAQYANILTPDYSMYTEIPMSLQIYNTFRNRWCGAYWQYLGISVIPTVSWSTPESYDFCFDGIESGSIVAISTIGCDEKKDLFLSGYFELKNRINPQRVLCVGQAFHGMGDEVISVPYLYATRRLSNGRSR